jgi:hypothetical protein
MKTMHGWTVKEGVFSPSKEEDERACIIDEMARCADTADE